ncbi:MAG: hypothetical protein ABIZ04_13425 [Opitutus sp.]
MSRHYSSKQTWRWIIGAFFVAAGANHFVNPEPYLAMMPAYLPAASVLVSVSGWAEIAGGVGVLWAPTRALAGWGLIALLVAVFPANLNVALHGWPGVSLPLWSLWLRLPLQLVMIGWVYWICVCAEKETPAS